MESSHLAGTVVWIRAHSSLNQRSHAEARAALATPTDAAKCAGVATRACVEFSMT